MRWIFLCKLNPAGRYLTFGLFVSSMLGTLTLTVPVYHILLAVLFLFVCTVAGAAVFRPVLEVTVRFPESVSVNRPALFRISVRNRGRFPVFDLSAGFFLLPAAVSVRKEALVLNELKPGESAELELVLVPRQRGFYELPSLEVFSLFPFHMWRNGPSKSVRSLVVFPEFTPLTSLGLEIGRRYQPGGMLYSSSIGESAEYIGNREYRPGDMLRKIDFRSWGRLARPAVKEYQEEYYCRIALVLDTFVDPSERRKQNGFPSLEAAVSLSAAVSHYISGGEYVLDIFAAGPDLYTFRSGRNIAHFKNVLEILACVRECRDNPFQTIAPAFVSELSNITTVVFILLDWDPARESFVRHALECGAAVRNIIVRSTETTADYRGMDQSSCTFSALTPEQISGRGVEAL